MLVVCIFLLLVWKLCRNWSMKYHEATPVTSNLWWLEMVWKGEPWTQEFAILETRGGRTRHAQPCAARIGHIIPSCCLTMGTSLILGWMRPKPTPFGSPWLMHQGAMTHNDTILDKKFSGSAKILRVSWAGQWLFKVFQLVFWWDRAWLFPTRDESDLATDPGNRLVVTGSTQGPPPKKTINEYKWY